MHWIKDDGGRAAAGYKGTTGDCVVRAVAIATGLSYQTVYDGINAAAVGERRGKRKRGVSSARTGVYKQTWRRYVASLGWRWVPTMQIGSGCTVHLRADELPSGPLIVSVSKHMVAVIDGVLHDLEDTSRDGTRCVYGYFIKDEARTYSAGRNLRPLEELLSPTTQELLRRLTARKEQAS